MFADNIDFALQPFWGELEHQGEHEKQWKTNSQHRDDDARWRVAESIQGKNGLGGLDEQP